MERSQGALRHRRASWGRTSSTTLIPGRDTPGLDNNAYTQRDGGLGADAGAKGSGDHPAGATARDRRACCGSAPKSWRNGTISSRKLFVPFHDDGVISQFEGYEQLEELDWDAYRAKYGDVQRLDRILEAEGDSVNRYKASKQADVLMLFYLLSMRGATQAFQAARL